MRQFGSHPVVSIVRHGKLGLGSSLQHVYMLLQEIVEVPSLLATSHMQLGACIVDCTSWRIMTVLTTQESLVIVACVFIYLGHVEVLPGFWRAKFTFPRDVLVMLYQCMLFHDIWKETLLLHSAYHNLDPTFNFPAWPS